MGLRSAKEFVSLQALSQHAVPSATTDERKYTVQGVNFEKKEKGKTNRITDHARVKRRVDGIQGFALNRLLRT